MSQGPFSQRQAWQVLNALLAAQLAGVDVQAISERDFNQQGEIIMNPPSLRTFYGGAGFASTTDSQRLSYESVARFMLLCAAEDLHDAISQAYASVDLVDRVCDVVAGTRLNLPAGDRSEPITIVAIEPVPVEGVGTAYALAIEVPGLAQFKGMSSAGYVAAGVTA